MNDSLISKTLAVAVILLFFNVSIIPSTGTTDVKQITMPTIDGDTLYVGGSGSNNYTKIQDAIDNASDGDTVFVYNGTYVENVVIDKSINLIGEDRETTTIDGYYQNNAVIIYADWVNISGFTIINSADDKAGVAVHSNFNTIKCNKINAGISHSYGIWLHWYTNYNNIDDNIISFNRCGIVLSGTEENIISENIISDNYYGIETHSVKSNKIINNNITSNRWCGIFFDGSYNNISKNIISQNGKELIQHGGIILTSGFNNKIFENNFINNSRNGYFNNILSFEIFGSTIWKKNYWDKLRYFPYLIIGNIRLFVKQEITFSWINLDWHPAKEPYDI